MWATLVTVILVVAAAPQLAHSQQHLSEGSKCVPSTGSQGVCRRITDCAWAMDEVRKGRKPKVCSFQGPYVVVCCPGKASASPSASPSTKPPRTTVANRIIGRKAWEKCREYASFVFAEQDSMVLMPTTERVDLCAASADPLIVGGKQAKSMEFPHMALIGYGQESEIQYLCGGSLISPTFVLTASHCLNHEEDPARWVLLGELDRSTTEDDAQPQRIAVAERIKHPEYRPPATYNDIALLRLAHSPDINGYVRPACLHTEPALRTRTRTGAAAAAAPNNEAEEVPIATGWGNTEWEGDTSEHLMKVALREADPGQCQQAYATTPKHKLPNGIRADVQICAGGKGRDTCQGDSGGPLQVSTKNLTSSSNEPYCMYKIVGVTSFGQACGFNAPGVYARVYHYVPWIEGIVWP